VRVAAIRSGDRGRTQEAAIGSGTSMAHILPFRSAAAPAEPERGPGGEPTHRAGAQIIIFPGVRRERHDDPAPQAVKQQRRRDKARPRRDRLELPD